MEAVPATQADNYLPPDGRYYLPAHYELIAGTANLQPFGFSG
jgi:hypothetical protein